MRTTLKATTALVLSLGVMVGAVASARSTVGAEASGPGDPAGQTTSRSGSGAGSEPGSPGTGNTGSTGGAILPGDDCGKQTVNGTGPDATVSYEPCSGNQPPAPEPSAQPVEPRPGMADLYTRPFDSATVGDDDRTVTIDFVSGIEPCYVLDHVAVSYGGDAVTITLLEGHDPSSGQVVCIDIAVFKSVTITLEEPLAGRTIVDGAAS